MVFLITCFEGGLLFCTPAIDTNKKSNYTLLLRFLGGILYFGRLITRLNSTELESRDKRFKIVGSIGGVPWASPSGWQAGRGDSILFCERRERRYPLCLSPERHHMLSGGQKGAFVLSNARSLSHSFLKGSFVWEAGERWSEWKALCQAAGNGVDPNSVTDTVLAPWKGQAPQFHHPPPARESGINLPLITCPKSSSGVSPKKGTQPTRNSYRIMPIAHQSTGLP